MHHTTAVAANADSVASNLIPGLKDCSGGSCQDHAWDPEHQPSHDQNDADQNPAHAFPEQRPENHADADVDPEADAHEDADAETPDAQASAGGVAANYA